LRRAQGGNGHMVVFGVGRKARSLVNSFSTRRNENSLVMPQEEYERMLAERRTVETWGRGIKLILDECAKANLPEPQIVAEGGYTRTVFMRPAQNDSTKSTQKSTQKTTLKTTQKTTLKTTQKILNLLQQNPSMTRMQISDAIGLSLEGVKWNLDKLKASGIIRRVGPDRGGHWEIVDG